MESKGLAETSLRRGHGSVQVERLYKKQPAIHRKIWFQTTIVRRFQYPFRRRRLHVSTRVSKPIQEDVFSLVAFNYIYSIPISRYDRSSIIDRSIDRERNSRLEVRVSIERFAIPSLYVRRAQFKNLPLACSYRAQIRFIAESATNGICNWAQI